MKITVLYMVNKGITRKEREKIEIKGNIIHCDWCDSTEKITWNTYIDYLDEWFFRFTEMHYLCEKCLLKIAQATAKKEMVEL